MHSAYSTVLFLCSGNYYRSRFAELLFNARAREQNLAWLADSRGLAPECFSRNPGAIAQRTVDALSARGITFDTPHRLPLDVTEGALASASQIVALKEAEHRQILRARFPNYEKRVEYWHVHDIDAAPAEEALPAIEHKVLELLQRFARFTPPRA
jgi:protein-tyrosine phosphatase